MPSTSRVVYDIISHSEPGDAPNYGYEFSTVEDSEKKEYHIALISGLEPNTTYYWRAVSHGSGEILGEEMSFTTLESFEGLGGPTPSTDEGTGTGAGQTEAGTGEITGSGSSQENVSGETTTEEATEGIAEFMEEEPEMLLAALPLERLLNYFKNSYWPFWLLFLIVVIYLLYSAYRYYIDRKNKS